MTQTPATLEELGERTGVGASVLADARRAVAANLAPTPLIRYHAADMPVPVYLKYEGAQPTGSFKVRGAMAALTAYASQGRAIVTASAGNHALGVAHASGATGVAATVVVPRTASPAKIEKLRTYPIELLLEGEDYDGAEAAALELAARPGGPAYVSAYGNPHVIAGQSTLVHEVSDELGGDFTIVVPVGGGGLVSGTALGAAASPHDVRVVGVESDACHAVSAAVAAGGIVQVPIGETIADGLVGNLEAGCVTPDIVRALGVALVDVPEAAIRRSVREYAVTAGLVAEGSSAAALAALRAGLVPADRPIVLIVSGRNIATPLLAALMAEA